MSLGTKLISPGPDVTEYKNDEHFSLFLTFLSSFYLPFETPNDMPAIRKPRQTINRCFITALQYCQDAITRRYDLPKTQYLFVSHEASDIKIQQSLENYKVATEQRKTSEYKAMFTLGQGLIEIVAANDKNIPGFSTVNAADMFGITPNHTKIALRIYTVFREWPEALDHMTKMPLTNWRYMSEEECGLIQLRLAREFNPVAVPSEWDITCGPTINGYQVDGETGESSAIYGPPQAQRIDPGDYFGYNHSSENRSQGTDISWGSHS